MVLYYSAVEALAGVSEWQTRQTQNLLWATTYGFKSHCRHYEILILCSHTAMVHKIRIFLYKIGNSQNFRSIFTQVML